MKKFYKLLTIILCLTILSCGLIACSDDNTTPPATVEYTVTFNSDGGSAVDMQTVKSGEKVVKPSNPTKNGFTFVSWTLDGADFDFNTVISKDITLVAKYVENSTNTFTVTFNTDGGASIDNQIIVEGEKVIKPSNPTKQGYVFEKWTLNGVEFNFDTVITEDITLVAVYSLEKYTVTFDSLGGTEIDAQKIENGSKVVKPTDPVKQGYNFIRWTFNGVEFDFNTEINSSIVLVAEYEEIIALKYTVTFNSNGGTEIDNQIIIEGQKAVQPTNPTRQGYVFEKWTLDGADFDFNTIITKNITLVAVYSLEKYTITFDSLGGTEIDAQIIENGSKAVKPTDPIKEGYDFVKWLLNGVEFDFNTEITSSIVLTAEYQEKEPEPGIITVTFDTKGGTIINAINVLPGQTISKPNDPIKTSQGSLSYVFEKWTLNGVEFDFSTPISENITLEAVYAVYGGTIQ